MSDPRITLLTYPYVVVRLRCDRCRRSGGYRLARLVDKFGATIPMDELLERLTTTCVWLEKPRKGATHYPEERVCRAYFPDLESPQPPPDLPNIRGLRVVDEDGKFRRPRKRA